MIQSDLKIAEFIFNKAFIASVPGSVPQPRDAMASANKPAAATPPKAIPYSIFSYEIAFVASYGGNITPTWKFARITADPSSPLFMSSRQKTNDLTVTLGPATPATKNHPALVSSKAEGVSMSLLIGQAVASSIQSQSH
jgi:hypothetical protein